MAKMIAHEKGRTTKLTVNQLLESIFKLNENPSRSDKFTDTKIVGYIQNEFDSPTAVDVAEVSHRRRQYNYGMGFWKNRGAAYRNEEDRHLSDRPFSYAYDTNGSRLPETAPRAPRSAPSAQSQMDSDTLRQLVQQQVADELAERELVERDQVTALVAKELAKERPSITINVPERKHVVKIAGNRCHKAFQKVLTKVQAGVPVLLVGPAGSGKTFLAAQVAEALGLPFTFNSMSEGTKESDLLGRTLPDEKGNWSYQPAPFVSTYTKGGVHLLDEIDAADPNLLVQINAAIANGKLSIPFRNDPTPLPRHKDSVILAAANTFGTGANRQYVGRNQLDAATLNRFTMGTVEINYDTDLESEIVKAVLGGEITPDGESLLRWAWTTRDRINAASLRRLMSSRNIEDGAKLLRVGESLAEIKATYFSGWTQDEKAKVAA
jgi:MoxR-like ATPase